jgi:pyochelin synthetase
LSKPQPEQDLFNDIAIVSMICRFPGIDTVEQYWDILTSGTDMLQLRRKPQGPGIEPFAGTGDSSLIAVNTVLEGTEKFDASFFKLTKREAEITDPQHRIFLEGAWEALEKAGYNPLQYDGLIGLFAGVSSSTYLINHLLGRRDRDESVSELQLMIANDKDHMVSQVAYRLNLRGPVAAVQTSCSTSLVAAHMACESLLSGQCDLALAGGVTIKYPQVPGYGHHTGGLTASDGAIRAFDADATGTVYSNGLGIVVLKRLEDALEDGDCIQAVIKGSAINSDGAARIGYAAPGVEGQTAVIAEALSVARVTPDSVSYIEAHGSGTPLGDDIELEALSRAFRSASSSSFCALGSVKTNIGHAEMASGAAGLIKTALALKHRQIPASLHFETPNPKLEDVGSPFYVNNILSDWIPAGDRRIAGVSAFGLGGINAHLVLEEAPEPSPPDPDLGCDLLVLSAKTGSALRKMAANLARYVQEHPAASLSDIAYTLKTGRACFAYRKAMVFRSRRDLLGQLQAMEDLAPGELEPSADRKAVFRFADQAALTAEQAGDLYKESPLFRELLQETSERIREAYPFDLVHAVLAANAPESPPAQRLMSFGLQYSLARLFLEWGIEPHEMYAEGNGAGESARQVLSAACPFMEALERTYAPQDEHGREGNRTEWSGTGYTLLNFGQSEAQGFARSGSGGQATLVQVHGLEWLQTELSGLWLSGAAPRWNLYDAGGRRRKVELPTYPFEREVFWVEPASYSAAPAAPSEAAAPTDGEIEQIQDKVRLIWEQSLGQKVAGLKETFFELGGHSLLATQILFVLNKTFRTELTLQQFFDHPTVEEIAGLVSEQIHSGGITYEELPEVTEAESERYEPFPLTDVQKAYWIGRSEGMELGNVATHMYFENDMRSLDLLAFNRAFNRMIERHEMLRAVILPDGRQQILAQVPEYDIQLYALEESGVAERELHTRSLREEMSHQMLDCSQWPLFDVRATCLPDDTVRLHISIDLLITDAWSLELLLNELSLAYSKPEHVFPPLRLSFRDYILAQERIETTGLFRRSREYWLNRLDTLPMGPQFELVKDPAHVLEPEFRRRTHILRKPQWQQLKKRADEFGITSTVTLLSAFAEVLTLWSRKAHFCLNLTLFNRLPIHPEVNEIIGDFTSLTLLEINNRKQGSFITRARANQRQLLLDMDHRYFSGVRVTRELLAKYKEPSKAVVPVIFTSILNQSEALQQEGTDHERVQPQEDRFSISQTPQVWLDHQVIERDGELHFNWDVVEDLFPAGMIDDMFAAYCSLLELLAGQEAIWDQLLPLSGGEAAAMPHGRKLEQVASFHTNGLEQKASFYSNGLEAGEGSLHGMFQKQVRLQPEAAAVKTSGRVLSYAELNGYANYVAGQLVRAGVRPGELVAVTMEKGWEQIAAVLGILKAKAAYLPMDATLPRERILELLALGQVRTAIVQKWTDLAGWPRQVHPIVLDETAVPDGEYGESDREASQRLAYVMFTSGSTGVPKGVMIDHRSAVNTIEDMNRTHGVGSQDVMLGLSSLSFDLSVYDIFGLLSAGGTLVLPDKDRLRDPAHWLNLIAEHGVTLWNTVPALMNMLTEFADDTERTRQACASLRLVLLSGDWIPLGLPDAVRRLQAGADILSLGGATEASIWSIAYPVHSLQPEWSSIPYGRSMGSQRVYVLNERMEECPVGVSGELYIGGSGVALGYWKDEQRTLERFLRHPRSGERLYRTGDMGRYSGDGNIEFMGREDLQVKIRGYRIELGEIETALKAHTLIKDAVVIAEGAGERKRLSAYVAVDREQAYGVSGLDGEDLITDHLERMVFKLGEPAQRRDLTGKSFALESAGLHLEPYLQRRSYRCFSREPIGIGRFSDFAGVLSQRTVDGLPFPKYQYGSAGGLYPVQVYFYLKEGAVEGLPCGIYYYDRKEHRMVLVEENPAMPEAIHAPGNRDLFQESAFTVFLIGCMDAITPLYGQKDGLGYSLMEAGIISQLLESKGPEHGIGLIQIGTLGFDLISPMFKLGVSDRYLHCLLGGGIEAEQMTAAGTIRELDLYSSGQTGKPETKIDVGKILSAYLREKLPAYMVPSAIQELDAFPLTPNGKVDRKALIQKAVEAEPAAAAVETMPREHRAEARAVHKRIIGVWQEALSLQEIGLHDNFFDLGGDSISMVTVYRKLQIQYGQKLSMVELFRYPTVHDLAEFLLQEEMEVMSVDSRPSEQERANARRTALAQRAAKHPNPRSE